MVGDGEEQQGQRENGRRREQAPGQKQEQLLEQKEKAVCKKDGLHMAVHPGCGLRRALQGDELAQVEEEQRGKADNGKAEPWTASPRPPPEAEHTITLHGAHPILSGQSVTFGQVFSHCRRRKRPLSMGKRHKNRKRSRKPPKKAPARIVGPGLWPELSETDRIGSGPEFPRSPGPPAPSSHSGRRRC